MPKYIEFLLLLITFCSFSHCKSEKTEAMRLNGKVFGSYFDIQYFGKEDLSKEIESLFHQIDKSLSTYREDSEIALWNQGNDSLKLSPYFIEVAQIAQNVYQKSEGYYDPSVKSLVQAWGFSGGHASHALSKQEVDSLMKNVGFDQVQIIAQSHRIRKKNKALQLDFNSIVPGYTADKVAEVLKSKGIQDFLIDIGGEIRAEGENKSNHSTWKVGLEDPTKDLAHRDYRDIVALNNQSLATSGNYRKIRVDEKGRKWVHTIDPKTGFPKNTNLLSATVLRPTCAEADAYATAAMAMGDSLAFIFFQKNHITSYLMISTQDTIHIKKTQ